VRRTQAEVGPVRISLEEVSDLLGDQHQYYRQQDVGEAEHERSARHHAARPEAPDQDAADGAGQQQRQCEGRDGEDGEKRAVA